MKTFLMSGAISIILLTYLFLPTITSAPQLVIPRIAAYLLLPTTMLVSIVLLAVQHLFEQKQTEPKKEAEPTYSYQSMSKAA